MRNGGISGWVRLAVALACAVGATDGAPAAPRDVTILTWQETVALEHADRLQRLRRLSGLAWMAPPEFHESLIRRADLPTVFGVDIPVLRVVFPQNVFFDTAADRLRPEAARVLDVVAAALSREASDTAVFVAGHTDSRGDDASNYDLSVRRAETVAVELKGRGVRQAQIWRVGFGEAVPRVPNTSDANMARNRRVEFLFARKPEAVGSWLSRQRAEVCRGASPAVREDCLRAFVALPRVEAVPVTGGPGTPGSVTLAATGRGPAVLPSIDPSGLRSVTPGRQEVGPSGSAVQDVPAERARVAGTIVGSPTRSGLAPPAVPERDEVVIGREERVIVDMQNERVLVNRPQR